MKRYIKSSTRSDIWKSMSPASQMAAEYALGYIESGEPADEAIRMAVKQIAEANYFDEYADEDFYGAEPDEAEVRAYVDACNITAATSINCSFDPATAEAIMTLIGVPRPGKYRVTYKENGRPGSQVFIVDDAEDLYEQLEAADIGIGNHSKGFTYIFDVTK